MLVIQNLELHVAHSCNLACESCTHYSNQNHKGVLGLEEAERWFAPWSERLRPFEFSLLGGEPTINPLLGDFVTLSRRYWPASRLRLVTNGFLLHRHPDLPRRLAEAGNSHLYVSVHHTAPAYQERLRPVGVLLRRWVDEYGISVSTYPSTKWWHRTYHGFGSSMLPFEDENPRSSWEHCMARYCPQLLDAKIWKCGPLAYLPMQHAKYGLSDKWRPYLEYEPLTPECSDAELAAFFGREDEAACAMCPARPAHFELPLPFPSRAAQSSG